jgi:tyrosinase
MEGQFNIGLWGVHAAGHYTISGDPGGDFFLAPGDPAFWLHHGMIDRVWWIWQMQDMTARRMQTSMTLTFLNQPPTRNGTIEDTVDLGILGPAVKLSDLVDTLGGLDGKMCYLYV